MSRLTLPALALVLLLAGCAGPDAPSPAPSPSGSDPWAGRTPDAGPDSPPDLSAVRDAVPREEPRARYGNPASYEVFGETYHVKETAEGYEEEGRASWYGTKFHGRRTSSGETYDMYAMTAAHRTLPLPAYAEVTNLDNGKRVVVRINDRGPFVDNRIIDLSYAAAYRLDMVDAGTAPVRVRTITAAGLPTMADADGSADAGEESGSSAEAATEAPVRLGEAAGIPEVDLPEGERLSVTRSDDEPESGAAEDNGSSAEPGRYFLQLGAFGDEDNARRLRDRLASKLSAPIRVHSENGVHRVKVGPMTDMRAVDQAHGELHGQGLQDFHLVER